MKSSRAYAVDLIHKQLGWTKKCSREKGHSHHYGKQELRELLDFIYGEPRDDSEKIK